jgi:multicomponent Na+:H+ antiporter subunit G
VSLLTYAALAMVGLGLFFTLVAAIGLVRMPDVYTRAHATSKTDTLGTVLTLAGVALLFDGGVARVKLLLLAVFMLITSPTATHAITRAALDQGIEPWTVDEEGDEA